MNTLSSRPRLIPIQTDSTRAQDLEQKIQSRVNAELTRIRDSQNKQLSDLTSSLTTNPPSADAAKPVVPSAPARDPNSLAAHLSSPFYHDDDAPSQKPKPVSDKPQTADSGRSHDSVQKEIMALKQKLSARKKVEKVTPEVEKAKESLVQCLRTNDRRPLDCWQEVEEFKREVGRLEQAFVQKVGR